MRSVLFAALICVPLVCAAEAGVIAARDLPPGSLIGPEDVVLDESAKSGLADPSEAVGLQARIAIYRGRPVTRFALQEPVLVQRNGDIKIIVDAGSFQIETDGRALEAGASGDRIKVMNLASKNIIMATIGEDGVAVAN